MLHYQLISKVKFTTVSNKWTIILSSQTIIYHVISFNLSRRRLKSYKTFSRKRNILIGNQNRQKIELCFLLLIFSNYLTSEPSSGSERRAVETISEVVSASNHECVGRFLLESGYRYGTSIRIVDRQHGPLFGRQRGVVRVQNVVTHHRSVRYSGLFPVQIDLIFLN